MLKFESYKMNTIAVRVLEGLLRDPTLVAPANILYEDVYGILVEYDEHLVLEDVSSVSVLRP